MNRIIAIVATTLLAANLAFAQTPVTPANPATAAPAASDCEAKAVSKSGKPLTGAAKAASIKKCEMGSKTAAPSGCEEKAVDKNGKPLHGAAKKSFMKKCEADATK